MAVLRSKAGFAADLAFDLAVAARSEARPAVERASRTLADAMQVRTGPRPGHADVFIPHYWAEFVHDGRRAPVFPNPPVRAFVWFADPKDDPRLIGGKTPERVSQLRRLSLPKGEFRELIREGRLIIRTKIEKPTAPTRFFDNSAGMKGFREVADRIAAVQVSDLVTGTLREQRLLNVSGKLRVRLA